MVAGAVMLLACMMTDAGTPWRRAMVSMVSPAATVTAVPPSQLQLPDDPGLCTTDPVTSEVPERPGPGTEFTATDVAECGCGICAVCACGIDAVSSELLWEAKGLSLKRVVSALQAATPTLTSASTAARGENRERNISEPPDITPTRTQNKRRVNTLRVNTTLRDYGASTLPPREHNRYNSRAFPGKSGTNRTPIRSSCLIPCSPFVSLTSCCGPACGPSGNTITPPSASSPRSASGIVSAAAVTMMRS